jgi:hypothetical protein
VWIDIRYPQAVFDEDAGRWISDAGSGGCAGLLVHTFTLRPEQDEEFSRYLPTLTMACGPAY